MTKKKNIPFIVALSIPVFMIVLTAASIYIPQMFVKPKFDFIYTTGQYYCHNSWYRVENQKVARHTPKVEKPNHHCANYDEPRLFHYDVENDTVRELTLEEAQKFRLDTRRKSLDGFEIVHGSRSFDVLFFSGSSYYDKFLKKGTFSRKLKIDRSNYYYNFKFLGWIKE